LANGWGANALSFDDNDLAEWPVSFSEMDAAYKTVYERIPVAGPTADDLMPHLRGVYPSQPPVRLSASDQRLLNTYQQKKEKLEKLGVRIGRARLAVVTDPSRPDACDYSERCLWGCPQGSIYNPRLSTLKECEGHQGFRYVAGRLVLALRSSANRIDGIRYLDVATREIRDEPCDVVFLAAGALQTGAIFLRTLRPLGIEATAQSEGLMDTTVVRIPFLALRGIGQSPDARSFQFNRLIATIVGESTPWPRYLHTELLHLTSLIYHPLIGMPFDTRTSAGSLRSSRPSACDVFFRTGSSGNHQRVVDHGGISRPSRASMQGKCREGASHPAIGRPMRSALFSSVVSARRSALRRARASAMPGPCRWARAKREYPGRSNVFRLVADGAAFPSLQQIDNDVAHRHATESRDWRSFGITGSCFRNAKSTCRSTMQSALIASHAAGASTIIFPGIWPVTIPHAASRAFPDTAGRLTGFRIGRLDPLTKLSFPAIRCGVLNG
jgi:hypothetical protein